MRWIFCSAWIPLETFFHEPLHKQAQRLSINLVWFSMMTLEEVKNIGNTTIITSQSKYCGAARHSHSKRAQWPWQFLLSHWAKAKRILKGTVTFRILLRKTFFLSWKTCFCYRLAQLQKQP